MINFPSFLSCDLDKSVKISLHINAAEPGNWLRHQMFVSLDRSLERELVEKECCSNRVAAAVANI